MAQPLKSGLKTNILTGLQASHGLGGRLQGASDMAPCDSVVVWSFYDLYDCYKRRKLPKSLLRNLVPKTVGYNDLAVRDTLAWILGKCGSGARNTSIERCH